MRFFNNIPMADFKLINKPFASHWDRGWLFACSLVTSLSLSAQEPVIANGIVPDAQTKQQILSRLKGLYGENVVDQITVAAVTTPPEWRQTVLNSIQPELKNVTKGRLEIAGSNIQLSGKVPSEAIKATLTQKMTTGVSAVYKVKQQLEINASEQKLIDQALGNRIVEFESGSAILTPVGQRILDEMAIALNKVGNKSVRIIGHTDSQGNPVTNLGLSLQRANAVRDYLAGKGVNTTLLRTEGLGANQPVADNSSEEGRRRNRRIEFEVL
jgi:OOP family OmpA-OmpF porin